MEQKLYISEIKYKNTNTAHLVSFSITIFINLLAQDV